MKIVNCFNRVQIIFKRSRDQFYSYTPRPDKHGRGVLVPCKTVTCPVYSTVLAYTGQVTFNKVPETHSLNWSL